MEIPVALGNTIHAYCNEVLTLGIRPEHITVSPSAALHAKVEVAETLGSESYLYLNFLGQQLVAKVSGEKEFAANTKVSFAMKTERLHLFDPLSQEAIIKMQS